MAPQNPYPEEDRPKKKKPAPDLSVGGSKPKPPKKKPFGSSANAAEHDLLKYSAGAGQFGPAYLEALPQTQRQASAMRNEILGLVEARKRALKQRAESYGPIDGSIGPNEYRKDYTQKLNKYKVEQQARANSYADTWDALGDPVTADVIRERATQLGVIELEQFNAELEKYSAEIQKYQEGSTLATAGASAPTVGGYDEQGNYLTLQQQQAKWLAENPQTYLRPKSDGGVLGFAKGAAGKIFRYSPATAALYWGMRAANVPFEEFVAQPYYAGQRSRITGGSTTEQINAQIAGLPGIGRLIGGSSREDAEQTNTYAERAALTQQGGLQSIGEAFVGLEPGQHGQKWSWLADTAANILLDPLNAASFGAGTFRNVGLAGSRRGVKAANAMWTEGLTGTLNSRFIKVTGLGVRTLPAELSLPAQRAGRASYLSGTRIGRSLIEGGGDAVVRLADNPNRLATALDIAPSTAVKVLDEFQTGGREAAERVLREAFVDGEWAPRVSIRRQAAAQLGVGGAVGARGVPIVFGPKTIGRPGTIRKALDVTARGRGLSAVVGTFKTPFAFIDAVGERVGWQTPERNVHDAWKKRRGNLADSTVTHRLGFVWGTAQRSKSPQLSALIEDFTDDLLKQAKKAGVELDDLVSELPVTRALERLELMTEAMSGRLGSKAYDVVWAQLRSGAYKPSSASSGSKIVKLAEGGAGQKLKAGLGPVRYGTRTPQVMHGPTRADMPKVVDYSAPGHQEKLFDAVGVDHHRSGGAMYVPEKNAAKAAAGKKFAWKAVAWAPNDWDELDELAKVQQATDLAVRGQLILDEGAADAIDGLRALGIDNVVEAHTVLTDLMVQASRAGSREALADAAQKVLTLQQVIRHAFPADVTTLIPTYKTYRRRVVAATPTGKRAIGIVETKAQYRQLIDEMLSAGVPINPQRLPMEGFGGLRARAHTNWTAWKTETHNTDPKRVAAFEKKLQKGYASLDAAMLRTVGVWDEYLADVRAILDEARQAGLDDVDRIVGKLKTELKEIGEKYKVIENTPFGRSLIEARIDRLPESLRAGFSKDLEKAAKVEGGTLTHVGDNITKLLDDDDLMDEALRIAGQNDALAAAALRTRQAVRNAPVLKQMALFAAKAPVKFGHARVRGFAKMMLSLVESGTPGRVLLSGASSESVLRNQLEAINRTLGDLHADPFTRAQASQLLTDAVTEEDVLEVWRTIYREFAIAHGINPDVLTDPFDGKLEAFGHKVSKRGIEFGVDDTGRSLSGGVNLVTQRFKYFEPLNPDEVKRLIREARVVRTELLRGSDGRILMPTRPGERVAAGLRAVNPLNWPTGHSTLTGDPLRISDRLRFIHRQWKFNIVTNLYMAPIAAGAGFATGEGDWKDRLANAAKYGALGALIGPTRYIGRVAVIEERGIRYLWNRGFRPVEWVPGLSKWASQRGIGKHLGFDAYGEIRAAVGANPTNWVQRWRSVGLHEAEDWVTLSQKDTRYLDAWWRVVNWQLKPEYDEVANILLREKAGRAYGGLDASEAQKLLDDYLQTLEGQAWVRRMKAAYHGPKDAADAITRYREFIDQYIPNGELAAQRLSVAEVPRGALKQALKAGNAPEFMHAPRTWRMPRKAKDWAQKILVDVPQAVLSTPSAKIGREPFARWTYREEYLRLVRSGVDEMRAKDLATDRAVQRTNEVMFRIEDESRFAKKVDFIFPFQQPKEELVKVYAKLAIQHPAKTLRAVRLGALAINNGEERGVFEKDPFTGDYYLTIPGSARLGQLLFGGKATPNFRLNLNSMFFLDQGVGGVYPRPGGPYWSTITRSFINAHPNFYKNMDPTLRDFLFPFGVTGHIGRPEARRLWYGLMGLRPAPWEFASTAEQENEIANYEIEIARHLVWQHRQENPGDVEWLPSIEEIETATKQYFQTWALVGGILPGSTKPVFPHLADIQALKEAYTIKGVIDWAALYQENPWADVFLNSKGEYVGPDDFAHWASGGAPVGENDDFLMQSTLHERAYKPINVYRDEIKEGRRVSRGWQEFDNILDAPSSRHRDTLIAQWQTKYPDLVAGNLLNGKAEAELASILESTPIGDINRAVDEWRQRYGVSFSQYNNMRERLAKSGWKPNPWRTSRTTESVVLDVQKMMSVTGRSEEAIVATLNPAEQVKYWKDKQTGLIYNEGENVYQQGIADPDEFLDQYGHYGKLMSSLYQQYPELIGTPKPTTQYTERWNEIQDASFEEVGKLFDELEDLGPAIKELEDAGEWNQAKLVKARRDQVFELIRQWQNLTWEGLPALEGMSTQTQAVQILAQFGPDPLANEALFAQVTALEGSSGASFLLPRQATKYLNMTEEAQQAYVDDLLVDLSKGDNVAGRMWWTYLTDFDKKVLEANLPQEVIDEFKALDAVYQADPAGYWKDKYPDGSPGKGAPADITWALSIFEKYDPSGNYRHPPEQFDEYLALPPSITVRRQFLEQNPEVAEFLAKGPLSNMPLSLAYSVQQIVGQYADPDWGDPVNPLGEYMPGRGQKSGGRRYGGRRRRGYGFGGASSQESLDLQWAYSQMKAYNQRTGNRPDTYELWLAMPSGQEKAQYLRDHPEVQEWIRLGPMANMPDLYADVVRDIMRKYGKWTQDLDSALGQTMAEFYALPKYARAKFLEEHPELTEYWALLRSPEEQAMFQLNDQYWSLKDAAARRLFLASHPELGGWFSEQRNRRYELFLNRVAQFMGENTEMFEHYLQRQEDTLAELLRRYATMPMFPEVSASFTIQDVKAKDRRDARAGA